MLERNRDAFVVDVLTANTNAELLAAQAKYMDARLAVVADETKYNELKSALSGTSIEAAAGTAAIADAAAEPTDWVMAAIVGAAGLAPEPLGAAAECATTPPRGVPTRKTKSDFA